MAPFKGVMNMAFDPYIYTKDSIIQELLLLERHIRDGSVYICGCAWDQHLPMIEGLCSEMIKFAKTDEERRFFEGLMHTARDYRIKLQYGEEEETEAGNNNPGDDKIPEHCVFVPEPIKGKEAFDPESFRTLCPECPEARCSLCPPELECATRIIVACPKGEFKRDRCQVSMEPHVVYHGKPKPD